MNGSINPNALLYVSDIIYSGNVIDDKAFFYADSISGVRLFFYIGERPDDADKNWHYFHDYQKLRDYHGKIVSKLC